MTAPGVQLLTAPAKPPFTCIVGILFFIPRVTLNEGSTVLGLVRVDSYGLEDVLSLLKGTKTSALCDFKSLLSFITIIKETCNP